jgi:hypothetical protein
MGNYWCDSQGYIYFLHAPGVDLIKIGWSEVEPSSRLKGLRAGSPVPLEPIGIIFGDRTFERRLHRKFAASRMHGEWFRPSERLLYLIRRWAHPWSSLEAYERRPLERKLYTTAQMVAMKDAGVFALSEHPLRLWMPKGVAVPLACPSP